MYIRTYHSHVRKLVCHTLKGKCLATGTKSIMGDIEDLVKVRNTLDMCFDVAVESD